MSTRTRLLVLLLALSLGPMALLGLKTLRSLGALGQRVGSESREALLEAELTRLRQKVADAVVLYGRQSDALEHLIEDQVAAAEAALATGSHDQEWFGASDFDAGVVPTRESEKHRRIGAGGALEAIDVSLDEVAIHFAPDASRSSGAEDASRLATLVPTYAKLSDLGEFGVLWHYTSLETGLHSAYPGHGGYPREYDARKRGWYREAMSKPGQAIWSDPFVDVATRSVVTSIAHTIRGSDGKIVGVTGIDVSVPGIFQGFSAEVEGWRDRGEAMIVMPSRERGLAVLGRERAGVEARPWRVEFDEPTLPDPQGLLTAAFEQSRSSREPAMLRHDFDGEDALWAVAPIRDGGAFLAVAVPVELATRAANRLEGLVAEDFESQSLQLLVALLLVVVLVLGAALWTARGFTQPLQAVSATARAIADGDLASRTAVHRRDEIGVLSDSVNDMAASLEKLIDAQEEATLQALKALTQALQKKDRYTAGHSGRVKRYSLKLAERMGLDAATLDLLGLGALLHDLGKIGIPDAVLNKPAPLDDDEAEIMRQHPTFTASIIKPLMRFRAFAEIAAWHHERWDGQGYPHGLAGEEIPLLARIVAIADTWDAMTADRIYRKGMSIEKAVSILEAEVDSGQFDPELIRDFIAMVREEQVASASD